MTNTLWTATLPKRLSVQGIRLKPLEILNTERYAWLIHSWNYGVELHSLIGQDPDFCIPEIERCVREALLQDDRITAVDDFSFEKHKKSIAATFTVHTIYGDIESETEVTI